MRRRELAVGLEVPRFGSFARQIAPVTTSDVESCLEEQATSGGRLGEIMVRRGLLGPQDVLEVLSQQARWAAQMRAPDLAPKTFPISTYFSLCLPCYNEADVIAGNLDAALAILPEFVSDFEIIVVDDGSQDPTGSIAETYAESDARVRLVHHETNRGYGAAVTSGFRAARGDLVCLTDGDGQFSLVDLPQLLVACDKADVVFGYRYRRADVIVRSLNARCWNWLIRLLLGVRIRDLDCAFKLLPKWVVEQLKMTADGACISGEIVTQCIHGGLKIHEVPVNHYPRYHGDATGARLTVIGKAFRELPGLWKYRKTPRLQRTRTARNAPEPKAVPTTG
jgi:hypothetical protein